MGAWDTGGYTDVGGGRGEVRRGTAGRGAVAKKRWTESRQKDSERQRDRYTGLVWREQNTINERNRPVNCYASLSHGDGRTSDSKGKGWVLLCRRQ